MLFLHLHHSIALHKHPLFSPPFIFFNEHENSVSVIGQQRWETLQKSRRRANGLSFPPPKSAEKDSDYEIDPDKAREALKKLDEQLQSLSQKKPEPARIREKSNAVSDMNRVRSRMTSVPEEPKEFTSSDLINVALLLFVLTIFYNVIFLAVIKPAIDGPETYPEINLLLETLQAAPFLRV